MLLIFLKCFHFRSIFCDRRHFFGVNHLFCILNYIIRKGKVIEQISAWLNNDKLLSDMADDVMALLNEDDEMILALEAQLREVQSSIDNIMKAIEKGVVTRSTKSRLEELEAEEEKITLNIKLEEAKRPKITKEFIIFTLNKFRNLDLRFEKNKERLIDGLVKAIFVYDDYIKLILTFDDKPINIPTSDEIENMANSSDIQSNVSTLLLYL